MAEPAMNPPMMCAVCGVVLDRWLDGWIHSGEIVGSTDHIAVPVPYDESRLVAKCDFCADAVPLKDRWLLPARDFKIPMMNHWSRGGWMACACCASLVAQDQWNVLVDRYMARASGGDPEATAMMRAFMVQLYRTLASNTLGAVRPFQPGDELTFPGEEKG